MKVPFLDLQAQYASIQAEVDPAIQNVIESCNFVLGPAVQQFEQCFADYCGTKHCAGVSSGTGALELALRACNIGPGDEVITVANTFFATAEAISLVGATVVLVDCNEDDALINTNQIEAVITKKTKAIIPVHLYGQMADMDPIMAIAEQYNLFVIEDCAQAHGAKYKNKTAGSIGHAGAFSFYPGKNLGAYGEGGAIVTSDDTINEQVRILRNHGMKQKYYHQVIGKNDRLHDIQAAVLQVKLPHLPSWNMARVRNAELYKKYLAQSNIQTLTHHKHCEHVYHLFIVTLNNRDAAQEDLAKHNIQSGLHYPLPIHLQEAYANMSWQAGDFPIAEKLSSNILSLPMFPELTEEQIKHVCTTLISSTNGQ